MHKHVHYEIEKCSERSDPRQIEQDRERAGNHYGIDQHVTADRSAHAEMAMRDHLHLGQHRQHSRNGENTGDDTRGRGCDRDCDCEIEAKLSERGARSCRKRVIARLGYF